MWKDSSLQQIVRRGKHGSIRVRRALIVMASASGTPIRLHDLRHGAATLALAAHTDLKVIQQMLGHSSIVTTADTYTSVLPDVAYQAAASVAELVMTHARRTGTDLNPMTHTLAANATAGYYQT